MSKHWCKNTLLYPVTHRSSETKFQQDRLTPPWSTFDNWVLNASFTLNELFVYVRIADHHQQWEEKTSETKGHYHRVTIFKELPIGIRERRLPLLLLSLRPSLLQLLRAHKDMHKAKELPVSPRTCWTPEQLTVHLEWCKERSLQSFLVWNLLS